MSIGCGFITCGKKQYRKQFMGCFGVLFSPAAATRLGELSPGLALCVVGRGGMGMRLRSWVGVGLVLGLVCGLVFVFGWFCLFCFLPWGVSLYCVFFCVWSLGPIIFVIFVRVHAPKTVLRNQ